MMGELLQQSTGQELLDELLRKVQQNIYVTVAPFEVMVWRTKEPVSFALRMSGRKREGKVGASWADELFDCGWMRFRSELPTGVEQEQLVARIDVNGELCVVDRQGIPVRGLTNVKSTFDDKLGGPGKTVYALPPEAVSGSVVEFWADAGLNDLFGFVKDEGRIVLAEIATVREEVRQLYYDLETLRDWLLTLQSGPSEALRLQESLAQLSEELDCEDAESVLRAREHLAYWFSGEHPSPALTVHAIGHAHLDLAWLWPIRETIRKGARTFATALYNLERYPEYVFGMSQPQLYQWLKERYPDLYAKVKQAVAQGGIEPQGTFWVEPDCSMPSGESFVRQILYGARFFREEFGLVPNYCWQPDVFGYHGQLPQILRKSGHAFFMTQKLSWNVVNPFAHHSFHWEGIDGTRILTHMLPEETYNGPAAARSLRKIFDDYKEKEISDHALMAFGIGDGGGGPDAEHLERLRRAPRLPGLPEVRIGSAADFFEVWKQDSDKFPVWRGELYLERHQGTLTTQSLVKRNNRRSEIALRELEWAAYLAAVFAKTPYPAAQVERLWKEVLLYQFHDILPGSSIKRVYDECNARYAAILAELEYLTREAYGAVAAEVGLEGQLVVFNSLAWPREEWVRLEDTWHRINVPALGWAHVKDETLPKFSELSASVGCLENERIKIQFAEDGRVASFLVKEGDVEWIASGEFANDLVIIPDKGDAWDFAVDLETKDVWGYLREALERPELKRVTSGVDGPCAWIRQELHYRSSKIVQTIRLLSGAVQLEFDTEVDWREPEMMLRVRFPVAVDTEEASFEIPFGSIRRSVLDESSHQRAQIEVVAQQWVDLSGEDGGVALYNDCKYGFRIKGHLIDMTLLRSVPYPDVPLIGKGDRSGISATNCTDLGTHAFRYALRAHDQQIGPAELTQEARVFNTAVKYAKGAGASLDTHSLGSCWPEAIELAAVKPAEDGRGWIWRLVNLSEEAVNCSLPTIFEKCSAWECDLNEVVSKEAIPLDERGELAFAPFEIKTIRCLAGSNIPKGFR
ncbi:alpha-mannosidase [Coraliomargarita parva]|uniref:alpha-mannosidase n=1 Tax=Coraliomargarita parva TaxID=3014050 RepID=UPI0022B3B3E3|nr:glycoside hydrolase family 38 C-terminal domain-containing protein [Coraliomargarita parva]